jgi:serine/threonine protein kinase
VPARDEESATAIAVIDPLIGTIFDKRFHIDDKIAAGGFGAIYRATHVKSGHHFALKVLLPTLAQDLGIVARFRREGDTMTALRSPHTITAYELGQAPDRTLFIVMELLHGKSLFDHYESHGPFHWKRMVRIARQVCESLAEAHALGIVHRDLKPTNIHLETKGDDTDFVKVLDFGIAKILQGSDFDSADITNAGTMIGTLDYMSPEQMVGGGITGQTDIYTLGIVMYEMIAGTRPFPEAATAASALASMLKSTPQPLYLRAPVPEELNRIVMRCLEKETSKRYRTIEELAADLDRLIGATSDSIDKTRTLAVDTHKYDKQDEATRITPPPERVLDALRTPKVEKLADKRRESSWGDDDSVDATIAMARNPRDSVDAMARNKPHVEAEDDEDDEDDATLAGKSDLVIAASRPNARAGSVDATIAVPRSSGRPGSVDPTVSVPRQASIDDRAATRHDDRGPSRGASIDDRVATRHDDRGPSRGASIDDRASTRHDDRGPQRDDPRSSTRAGSIADRGPPRPDEAGVFRADSIADRAPARRGDETPGVDTQPRRRLDVDPEARTEPAPLVGRYPTPRPMARPVQTPVPSIVAAPFSSTPRTPLPQAAPQRFTPSQPTPFAPPPAPLVSPDSGAFTPQPQLPPPPRGQFDVSKALARDQMIRRLLWIGVLVVGTVVGILIATLLR